MVHEHSGTGSVSRRDLLRNAALGAGALGLTAAAPRGGSGASPAPGSPTRSAEPLRLARVWFDGRDPAALAGFDTTHRGFADGSAEILLWPGDLARLRDRGLRFRITVGDLVARDRAASASAGVRTTAAQPGETTTGDYRHLADFEADMRMLAERYPDKARMIELPCTTLERRRVYALEIASEVTRMDGRAVFYNDGVHHAREWPAAEVPMMWAFDLLENYGVDPRITTIVDNVRNIVVPVVNPDGFTYSREFPVDDPTGLLGIVRGGQGQYVRKNRRSYLGTHVGDGLLVAAEKPDLGMLDLDVYGVDPNRNYGFAWGGDGASPDQGAQDYRGDAPFSEAESRNVAWLLKTRQVTAMITHHTSGDLVLWPWGDTYDDAPDNALLEGFGRAMSHYNGYQPQKSIELYPTTGTTSDYAYGSLGTIAYTFEHAGSSFHPDYASTVPAMYARNREAFLLLCEEFCLRPDQRPTDRSLPAEVLGELEAQSLELGTLNHAIIRGRLAGREDAPGEVKLYRRFQTPLWKDGDRSNPLGQRSVEEIVETVHVTDGDSFEIHVNPSTRPKVAFAGGSEAYELVVRSGGRGAYREVTVARGEVVDLGTVVVR